MRKDKNYNLVRYSADVIKEAFTRWERLLSAEEGKAPRIIRKMRFINETWQYDSDEEFYSEYRKNEFYSASISKVTLKYDLYVEVYENKTEVSVQAFSRIEIESIFEIFEEALINSMLPPEPTPIPEPPVLFIGHGGSCQWRDLKDHLKEKHGYRIEAYEIGARAGHTIRDILEEMLIKSSFAILVMTGEDISADGKVWARQNVIHEAGLFQGKLGFNKAIIVLEEGTEEFSNIKGIHQIRFTKNNIKETFGELLATLRREFGPKIL